MILISVSAVNQKVLVDSSRQYRRGICVKFPSNEFRLRLLRTAERDIKNQPIIHNPPRIATSKTKQCNAELRFTPNAFKNRSSHPSLFIPEYIFHPGCVGKKFNFKLPVMFA